VFPCCRYKAPVSKFTGNVIDILDSDVYKKLREDSSNNIHNPNCQKCYNEEALGKQSLRQQFNNEYNTNQVSLRFLELGLDNICNLTCDGCWGEFSSSWAKKLNPLEIHVKTSDDIVSIPDSVEKILFLGGEPLMTSRHAKILNMVSNKPIVTVTYNTNGTFLLDAETTELLSKFKTVNFILSVDGYGELNELVRSGSKWFQIEQFIDQIKSLGFNLSIHTVLHKNNWHGLKDLASFVNSSKLPWTLNTLTHPAHLDIINVKEQCIEFLESIEFPSKEYVLNHLKG
jgi:sulfatase maturation enzyme AslB (radical SAM superfamily)